MSDPKSWPFEQARALLRRVGDKKCVTFQTGFGPSGSPHVGTFSEVVRTNMVRQAFEEITDGKIDTRLLAFSDDYDGFRRVPDHLPQSMEDDLGKPLTAVRDPYGKYSSFAERNNQALRDFLDKMEVGYEFLSATECYKNGVFNDTLVRIMQNYDAVRDVVLPTLGETRRATYSPFMPISPVTGNVLAEGVLEVDPSRDEVCFIAEDGKTYWRSIKNGYCKLQWKADWGMRWAALGVDYEMHGKDLIESATLSKKICEAIGAPVPLNYFFELFLDQDGHKISKSKGNGMDTWLRYSTTGPLAYYMFQNPRAAKVLVPDIIPRVTDEYIKALVAYPKLSEDARLDSPVWHVHHGSPPSFDSDISYGLLLNLATVSGAQDEKTLLNYLSQYKAIRAEDRAFIESLVPGVLAYTKDMVLPTRVVRKPSELEASAFAELANRLEAMADGLSGEEYQTVVYAVGKEFNFDPLRSWFQALYEVLFGDPQGPRFGSFVSAYGRIKTIEFLRSVL